MAFEDLEEDSAGLPEGPTASRLSTGEILLEASRRIVDPAVVREAIGDLDRKLVPASDPGLRGQEIALTPTDGFVLSRIDGTLSAREIVDLMPLASDETERSLLGLLCAGAIDLAPARIGAAPCPSAPAGACPSAPAPHDAARTGPGSCPRPAGRPGGGRRRPLRPRLPRALRPEPRRSARQRSAG